MHTDGETIYYRSDRPNRASARPERISVPLHSGRMEQVPANAQALRLEQVAERLERSLTQLTEALKQVTDEYIEGAAAKAARLMRSEGANLRSTGGGGQANGSDSSAGGTVRAGDVSEQSSDRGQPSGSGHVPDSARGAGLHIGEAVKVSLFAEGNARAILGHVRIQQEEND